MSSEQSTILIVDDVAENIDILHNLLRERYKVKAARSGEQALKIARQEPRPDMVLLDIMMPEMDGYEVIKVLKADEGTREIPVIFISAKGETGDETLGFSLGAADYITKPVSPPIVLARVQTHLTLHMQRQKLAEQNRELQRTVRILEKKLSSFSPASAADALLEHLAAQEDTPDYSDYLLKDHRETLAILIGKIERAVNAMVLDQGEGEQTLEEVGRLLEHYGALLSLYPLFKSFGSGMEVFGAMLCGKELPHAAENARFVLECLESLAYTLVRWHHQFFVGTLKDPHIFDNSMLADMQAIRRVLENRSGFSGNGLSL